MGARKTATEWKIRLDIPKQTPFQPTAHGRFPRQNQPPLYPPAGPPPRARITCIVGSSTCTTSRLMAAAVADGLSRGCTGSSAAACCSCTFSCIAMGHCARTPEACACAAYKPAVSETRRPRHCHAWARTIRLTPVMGSFSSLTRCNGQESGD